MNLDGRITQLESRLIESKGNDHASREFNSEQVEACKTLCLTFQEHFGRPGSLNWMEEQETDDSQKMGYMWLKNTAIILAHLARHPDLIEKVKAVPELDTLTRLVHAGFGPS